MFAPPAVRYTLRMSKRKPLFDLLSDDERQRCLDNIIAHFLDKRDEEVGIIAAEQILETVEETVATSAYNTRSR